MVSKKVYPPDNDPEKKYRIRQFNFNCGVPASIFRDIILRPERINKHDIADIAYGVCDWVSTELEYRGQTYLDQEEATKLHDERYSKEVRRLLLNPEVIDVPEGVLVRNLEPVRVEFAATPILINEEDFRTYKKPPQFMGRGIKLEKLEVNESTIVDPIGYFPGRAVTVDNQDVHIPLRVVKNDTWTDWVNEIPSEAPLRQRAREILSQGRAESARRFSLSEAERLDADIRARLILFDFLSESQKTEWINHKRFSARINDQIWKFEWGTHGNVFRLSEGGMELERFCIAPRAPHNGGFLPVEDVVLAQLLLIHADANEFRKIANVTNLTNPGISSGILIATH